MKIRWYRTAHRALFILLCMIGAAHAREPAEQRVLFIGNSLTYVNSLPAIFELVANAQPGSPRYRADMYVRGGASLTELDQDPQLQALLDSGDYQVVVLQERGGNDLCIHAPAYEVYRDEHCDALIATHLKLARQARAHGATVLYLGTYQSLPNVSALQVSAEMELSTRMAASYVEISDTLRRQQVAHPGLPWLYADRSHPGIATTTLMALRAYQALDHGRTPRPFRLCSASSLYTTRLRGHAFVPHEELTEPAGPSQCLLEEAQMRLITDALDDGQG
jgi:hypothetical protein